VFNYGDFCKGILFGRDTELQSKSGINSEKNRVFLIKEFLTQGDMGKIGIKNYMSDHHEFRDFWWNFYDFWISGAIKINSEKMEHNEWINQGLRFDHKLLWVQLGHRAYLGAIWR
jgi:hypothetical protein